jgi:hypothetical protein
MTRRRIPHQTPAAGDSVVEWRRGQLVAAGMAPETATTLAADCAVDVHALLELVDRGCPPALAARILAPLDGESRPC